MTAKVRRLEPSDDAARARFTCSDPDLDSFFRQFAAKNQFEFFVGTSYVAVDDTKPSSILGFVTVSPSVVTRGENAQLRAAVGKKAPRYPLPVLRVARLGVAVEAHGTGIGSMLLGAAFDLALAMSRDLGCSAVVVDAYPTAVGFYERFGFAAFTDDDIISGESNARPRQTTMFLPTHVILAAQPT